MDAAVPGDGPDLSGLQSSCAAVISRTLRWVMFIAFSLIAVSAVLRLFNQPDGWDIGLSVVQLLFYSLWLSVLVLLPPGVYLDPDGLRLRKFLRWGRLILWSRVREVKVQGRWQDVSTVVLNNGKSERLVGMPVEHAQRLAAALARWSAQ